MPLVTACYAVFTPAATILGNWPAEELGCNEYFVTGINMLLNVTTEFLWQKYVVYHHQIDTVRASEWFFNKLVFSGLNRD